MSDTRKKMKLAATLIAPGSASGGWRHPLAEPYGQDQLGYYSRLAAQAEAGRLDYLFLPDQYRVSATSVQEFKYGINVWPEPITLLSAMAAVTRRIGLSATMSTTYNEPYHVARMIASIDHLSGGRASWNVVQSIGDLEAANFKNDHRPKPEERDEHSDTFVHIVKGLWDSWDDDAIIADKQTGVFADPDKVKAINHESRWFSVKGPLNTARPPQGHPVLIQAGQSDRFRERAAQHADIIFTMLNDLPEAQLFYKDVKSRLYKYGRKQEDLLIMPGLHLYVGSSEKEAREKRDEYRSLQRLDIRLDRISYLLGIDAYQLSLDDPLPEATDDIKQAKYKRNKQLADRNGWRTIRELYVQLEAKGGHLTLTGTPVQIADRLKEWIAGNGADGFTFIPHLLPSGLDDLVNGVIPELQNRGLFRTEYEGFTLRDNLGLSRPGSRHEEARRV